MVAVGCRVPVTPQPGISPLQPHKQNKTPSYDDRYTVNLPVTVRKDVVSESLAVEMLMHQRRRTTLEFGI